MRPAAAVVLGILLAAAVAAPLAGAAGGPIYAAFSWVCHQRPERSWALAGAPLAVCIRCLGLYAGALAGAASGLRFSRRLCGAALAALAVEWLGEVTGLLGSHPAARLLAGFGAGAMVVPALWTEHRGRKLRILGLGKAGV